MSPEKSTEQIRAIARDEQTVSREERIAKEKRSTHLGWALFGVAGFVVVASVVGDLLAGERPEFSVAVVTVVVLLAFGGGALVQGVRLDKILTAWRKNGASS